jgi:hypothetical protein
VEQPRSVAEIVERVRASWAMLLEAVAGLSDAQLVEPGPEGWSVKDHLAHIMVWDSVPTTILSGQPQRVAFGLDETTYSRIDSVDQLNALIYSRFRDVALDEVRSTLQRIHSELVAALELLGDADLDRSIASFGGDADDQRPLRDKIEGDSWGHYAEHAGWLRELRESLVSS